MQMFETAAGLADIENAYIAKVNAAIASDDEHLAEELSAEFADANSLALRDRARRVGDPMRPRTDEHGGRRQPRQCHGEGRVRRIDA